MPSVDVAALTLKSQRYCTRAIRSAPRRAHSISAMSASKTVHLLRHGQTEMNVYLEEHEPGFEDPQFFDTKLTDKGKREAKEAIARADALQPSPQLLLASPLSRALQTADITFQGYLGRRMAVGLARERTYFASDVGVKRSELEKLWPHWSFEGVKEEVWWLDHTPEKDNPKRVITEPEDHFQRRMTKLKAYLRELDEQSIVLVVHRDVIECLAGGSPANCEFASIKL